MFTLDGSPRTIGIKAHGTGSLVLRAVVCQWFNDKPAWDDLPFTLPLNGKTARLDWAIPAPQAQYAIVGLACALLLAPPA